MRETRAGLAISEMTLDDLDAVLALERVSFSNPWPGGAFESDLESDLVFCYVVRDRSRTIVAFSCLQVIEDEAQITNIAVDPAHRRSGIGSMLIEHMTSVAIQRGCTTMFLEVRVSNYSAISLYEQYGFIELYRRRKYYLNPIEDAIVMMRSLKRRKADG